MRGRRDRVNGEGTACGQRRPIEYLSVGSAALGTDCLCLIGFLRIT
jgi:hypothetical protein